MNVRKSNLIGYLPFIIIIATQLHLLRNITSLYLLIYPIIVIFAIWYTLIKWHLINASERLILYFIILIFLVPIYAIIPGALANKYTELGDVSRGVSRIIFAFPIYLAVLSMPSDSNSINKLLFTAAVLTLTAAVSIPYQFIFGAVEWFAESSERSGFARYASAFGSLTAFGIVCGYGLLAAVMSIRSAIFLSFVLVGIVLGGFLSLQKAALVNLFISLLLIPLVRNLSIKEFVKILFAFICISTIFSIYFIDEISGFANSFRVFSNSDSDFTDDVSLSESIVERIFDYPLIAINHHGIDSLFFGLGPIGGGGGFGFPDIPNAHNGLVDLLLIGGAGYFIIFILFISFVVYSGVGNLRRGYGVNLIRFGLIVFCLLILNMTFSGLTFFTPSNALFFSISIKCIMVRHAA